MNNQTLLEAMQAIQNAEPQYKQEDETQADFAARAQRTKFAIQTEQGFWNHETQAYHLAVENGTQFDWLQQNDYISEAMEEIASEAGAWFKIVCVTPFKE